MRAAAAGAIVLPFLSSSFPLALSLARGFFLLLLRCVLLKLRAQLSFIDVPTVPCSTGSCRLSR